MYDGVDAAVMEINAAAMSLVHALPSDLAVGEDGVVDVWQWSGWLESVVVVAEGWSVWCDNGSGDLDG